MSGLQESLPIPTDVDGDWFWGVDPGATAIGFGWTNGQDRGTEVVLADGRGEHPQRLASLHDAVADMASRLAVEVPPALVFVEAIAVFHKPEKEKGFKHRIEPIVYLANGVVQAAVYGALAEVFEEPVPVLEVPVATWKARGLGKGHGHAKKPEIRQWARAMLRRSVSQDESDALGMAEAARATAISESERRAA